MHLVEHAYLWCVGPQLVQFQTQLNESTAELLDYWKAVKNLCRWLCEALWNQSRPAQAIEELRNFIFAGSELECQMELADPSWTDTVVVQGRVDALLRQAGTGRLCIVELKLGQTSPEADLAQACLYHMLLAKSGTAPAAIDLALWSFHPNPHERIWNASELAEAQIHLKTLVGQLAGVSADRSEVIVRPPSSTVARDAVEQRDMAGRLVSVFQEFGAPIVLEGEPQVGPAYYRFLAKPAPGVPAPKILKMATTIWPRLQLDQPPQIAIERGLITIDVERCSRQVIHWRLMTEQQLLDTSPQRSRFPVGIAVDGTWTYANLASPEHSHILVAGTNGSGKSEWLRMMLGSLCRVNSPGTLRLVVIDPKRTAFAVLAGSPFLGRPIVYPSDEDILVVLDDLVQQMEERYSLFEKTGAKDLAQYNTARADPVSRLVCVCDEYADLILTDSKIGKSVERRVGRIGAKGRAAGIHLVLATQRPSRDVVTGVIRANMNARVALKVNEKLESRIIIEQSGAESLLGKGDLLFKDLGQPIRLQSPLISDQELKQAARCP